MRGLVMVGNSETKEGRKDGRLEFKCLKGHGIV